MSSTRPTDNTVRTDEHGSYVAYHRRCGYQGCGAELTSRNRHQQYLLCKGCARSKDRIAKALRDRTPAQVEAAALKKLDPLRLKAHHLLEAVLNNPSNQDIRKGLENHLMSVQIAFFITKLQGSTNQPKVI